MAGQGMLPVEGYCDIGSEITVSIDLDDRIVALGAPWKRRQELAR